MERFGIVKHHNGTRTLIDNQTGMSFFRTDDNAVEDGIRILKRDVPTNTRKYQDYLNEMEDK